MEWISIEDRLPDDCQDVLIYCSGFPVIGAYLTFTLDDLPLCWRVNDWDESELEYRLEEVTHWMALPKPPEEK